MNYWSKGLAVNNINKYFTNVHPAHHERILTAQQLQERLLIQQQKEIIERSLDKTVRLRRQQLQSQVSRNQQHQHRVIQPKLTTILNVPPKTTVPPKQHQQQQCVFQQQPKLLITNNYRQPPQQAVTTTKTTTKQYNQYVEQPTRVRAFPTQIQIKQPTTTKPKIVVRNVEPVSCASRNNNNNNVNSFEISLRDDTFYLAPIVIRQQQQRNNDYIINTKQQEIVESIEPMSFDDYSPVRPEPFDVDRFLHVLPPPKVDCYFDLPSVIKGDVKYVTVEENTEYKTVEEHVYDNENKKQVSESNAAEFQVSDAKNESDEKEAIERNQEAMFDVSYLQVTSEDESELRSSYD